MCGRGGQICGKGKAGCVWGNEPVFILGMKARIAPPKQIHQSEKVAFLTSRYIEFVYYF